MFIFRAKLPRIRTPSGSRVLSSAQHTALHPRLSNRTTNSVLLWTSPAASVHSSSTNSRTLCLQRMSHMRMHSISFDLLNVANIHNSSVHIPSDKLDQLRWYSDSAEFAQDYNSTMPDRSNRGQTLRVASCDSCSKPLILRARKRCRYSSGLTTPSFPSSASRT